MRTQQTKLTPHCFAHPEKIFQPGSQPETPSPSFATAAAWLTTRASGTAQRGIVPRTARTLGRKVCRAQSTQRHGFAFCQHRGHANVSALRRQPNPALKRDVPQAARPLAQRWATPKPNQKRMRTPQTKLTQRRFAQPEKISQPGSQLETPSPSFVTAATCLAARASGTARRGIVPLPARTLGRKLCRAQSTQRHSFAFYLHRGHANVSALRRQPNPSFERDAPKAGRPSTLR